MDANQMHAAFLDALKDHAKQVADEAPRVSPGMIAIAPFEAENHDGEKVQAIGVVTNPAQDFLEFLVIKTTADGEMFPTTEGSLYRLAG